MNAPDTSPVSPLPSAERTYRALLLAVMLLAFGLRFTGLNWDGGAFGHSDERNVLGSVERVRLWDKDGTWAPNLDPEFYVYGGLPVSLGKLAFTWVALAEQVSLLAWLGWLLLAAAATALLFAEHLREGRLPALPPALTRRVPLLAWESRLAALAGVLALVGLTFGGGWSEYPPLVLRWMSALWGVCAVLVTARLGRTLAGEEAGLWAAALLAVTPLAVQQAHFGTVESLLLLLTTLVLAESARVVEAPSTARVAIAAAAAGLALATKTSGVVILLPLFLAVGLAFLPKSKQDPLGPLPTQLAISALIAFLVAFFGSPFTFLRWSKFLQAMDYEGKVVLGTYVPSYTLQFYGTSPFGVTLDTLFNYGLGRPLSVLLLLLGSAALVSGLLRRSAGLWVVAAFAAPYLITIGLWQAQFVRYQVPLLSTYALLAGWGVALLARSYGNAGVLFRLTGAVALVLTTANALAYVGMLSRPFTRVAATEWFYQNVPAGTSILHEGPWDEAVPIPLPRFAESGISYNLVSSMKDHTTLSHVESGRLRNNDVKDDRDVAHLAEAISRCEFVCLSSKRIAGALLNAPKHYAVSAAFYQLLFSGALGYRLERVFTDYPQLAGVTWQDDLAEESWQTNDHPKVFVFRRETPVESTVIAGMLRRPPAGVRDLTRLEILTMLPETFPAMKVDYAPFRDPDALSKEYRGRELASMGLSEPRGLFFDQAGNLSIADLKNYRVLVVDPSLRVKQVIGFGQGSEPGYFKDPAATALDMQGNVIVADTWNYRIQKFDANGKFLWEARDLFAPRGLTVDPAGNIYVADTGNGKVKAYGPGGGLLWSFSSRGTGPEQLQEPVGLALGPDGNLWVCDAWNARVQVFTTAGQHRATLPVDAWAGEHWREPAISFLPDGNFVITDTPQNRVLHYTQSGRLLGQLRISPLWGGAPDLSLPMGVAVNREGRILVADTYKHRLVEAHLERTSGTE